MLTKKRISIVSILGVLTIGLVIFLIAKPNQRDIKKAAIRGHIDTILSLSGKLTPEEKQIYFDNYFALGKYEITPDEEFTDFATPEELQHIQEHAQALFRENPDLEVPHTATQTAKVTNTPIKNKQRSKKNLHTSTPPSKM